VITVTQTIAGGPDAPPEKQGNCFAACIASILELPLDRAPHYVMHEDWWDRVVADLTGLGIDIVPMQGHMGDWITGYWIANVPSLNLPPQANGEAVGHSVVMRGHEIVWDPSTRRKREYLRSEDLLEAYILVPQNPALAVAA